MAGIDRGESTLGEPREGMAVEQLSQMELLQIRELFGQERLAVTKCLVYAREVQDPQLRQLFEEASSLHQTQADNLLTQLRRHDGKPPQTEAH